MARGSIVKRRDGVYGIRYYDPSGRRRYVTVYGTLRDAERRATKIAGSIDDGTYRETSKETLAEYSRRWLDQRDPARTRGEGRTRLAPSTFAEYRRALRPDGPVLSRLGSRTLASLRTEDVDALIFDVEAEGRAPGTVRNIITPLRKLLGDAVRQGTLTANPAARCDLPPAPRYGGQEISPEHTAALRAALLTLAEEAPPDPLRQSPDLFFVHLFDVALGASLRAGELRALRWRDVDFERKVLRIERAFSRSELREPKTKAGRRTVPLFPSVEAALRELAARALERGRYAPDELVFANAVGRELHWSNVNRRAWQPARERAVVLLREHAAEERVDGNGGRADQLEASAAELERLRPRMHDLRHTACSRLAADGADVKFLQTMLGHARAEMTLDRYSHWTDRRASEAASRFDPAVEEEEEVVGQ
jgi:integrase